MFLLHFTSHFLIPFKTKRLRFDYLFFEEIKESYGKI